MKKISGIILIGIFCTCTNIPHSTKVINSECLNSFDKMSECEILHTLLDSSVSENYFPNRECLNKLINILSSKSNIGPNWVCDYTGCNYYSYSMEKSIFKIDILRWMRYFGCKDSTYLKMKTGGQFSEGEMSTIKLREIQGTPIDTMILYL